MVVMLLGDLVAAWKYFKSSYLVLLIAFDFLKYLQRLEWVMNTLTYFPKI